MDVEIEHKTSEGFTSGFAELCFFKRICIWMSLEKRISKQAVNIWECFWCEAVIGRLWWESICEAREPPRLAADVWFDGGLLKKPGFAGTFFFYSLVLSRFLHRGFLSPVLRLIHNVFRRGSSVRSFRRAIMGEWRRSFSVSLLGGQEIVGREWHRVSGVISWKALDVWQRRWFQTLS